MNISQILNLTQLLKAQEIIKEKLSKENSFLDNENLSRALLKNSLRKNDQTTINAHLQAINTQLESILTNDNHLKKEPIYIEFAKGLTLFDQITNSLKLTDKTFGDNFVASQNFYMDAIGSYKKCVPTLYQGSLEISYIPFKLRLAIETYFKNMIGFHSAEKESLTGRYKGEIREHSISISDILRFLSDKKYKKYANLPISTDILRNINSWSNELIHTGIVSFPWQSMTAIDLLKPLFHTRHEDGHIHLEGFNYLNLNLKEESLEEDLSRFLSNRQERIKVKLYKREKRPLEGAYYYHMPDL